MCLFCSGLAEMLHLSASGVGSEKFTQTCFIILKEKPQCAFKY